MVKAYNGVKVLFEATYAVVHVCNGCATFTRHSVTMVHVAIVAGRARVGCGSGAGRPIKLLMPPC